MSTTRLISSFSCRHQAQYTLTFTSAFPRLPFYAHSTPGRRQRHSRPAPAVLGLGIPHTSPTVPDGRRAALATLLDAMESDMQASAYDWEMFYVEPNMDLDVLTRKLRERRWDVVMVGVGLRTAPSLTPFFETIVNAVHVELPGSRLAFNESIERTRDSVMRVFPLPG